MAAGRDDRNSLIAEMDKALRFPGVSQRLDHADQGAHRHALDRHPHAGRRQGVRHGSGRDGNARRGRSSKSSRPFPAQRAPSPNGSIGGYYLEIVPDRDTLARYGLMIGDVQDAIATALGGAAVTTTVEGRERYTVNVRYPRDLRSDPQSIASEVLVPCPSGGTVPLGRSGRGHADARTDHASAPRTRSSSTTSMSTSATAISAAMSPRRSGRSREQVAIPARLSRRMERAVRISGACRRRG